MSLFRDKIKDAILTLNTDQKQWHQFSLVDVAGRVADTLQADSKEASIIEGLEEEVKSLNVQKEELNELIEKGNEINSTSVTRIYELETAINTVVKQASNFKGKAREIINSLALVIGKSLKKDEKTEDAENPESDDSEK